MFSNVWEIHVFFIAVSDPSKYSFFEKTKFYILLIEWSENFFFAIFLIFRHIRMGKNCAHIEIQKLLLFWDTLLHRAAIFTTNEKYSKCNDAAYCRTMRKFAISGQCVKFSGKKI
jgi:hypothetical protein